MPTWQDPQLISFVLMLNNFVRPLRYVVVHSHSKHFVVVALLKHKRIIKSSQSSNYMLRVDDSIHPSEIIITKMEHL